MIGDVEDCNVVETIVRGDSVGIRVGCFDGAFDGE